MKKSIEEQTEFMERMLETYAQVHTKKYWDEIEQYIEAGRNGRVLDIGCGPGLLLRDINDKISPAKLIGLDLSPVMLEKAAEILEHVESGKVELLLKNMQIEDEIPKDLNLVLSSRVMRSFENAYRAFKMVYDAMAVGGVFVLLDWNRRSLATYEQYFSESGFFSMDPENVILRHRNFSRYDIEDFSYILKSVGFSILHSFSINEVTIGLVAQR